MKIKYIIFYLASLLFLNSCSFFSKNSPSDLYTSFFVGEDGTQFFIKTLEFVHTENEENLTLDVTFRYKEVIKDSVTINFTIYSTNFIKNIESVEIENLGKKYLSNNIKLIYLDKSEELCQNRYSVKFQLKDFVEVFKDDNFRISVFYKNYKNQYVPTSSTKTKISLINQYLISFINS